MFRHEWTTYPQYDQNRRWTIHWMPKSCQLCRRLYTFQSVAWCHLCSGTGRHPGPTPQLDCTATGANRTDVNFTPVRQTFHTSWGNTCRWSCHSSFHNDHSRLPCPQSGTNSSSEILATFYNYNYILVLIGQLVEFQILNKGQPWSKLEQLCSLHVAYTMVEIIAAWLKAFQRSWLGWVQVPKDSCTCTS